MAKIKKKEPAAFHWLRDTDPLQHWARFRYDVNLKCDDNTNNFVESFNYSILKHRGKPIYTLLEEIRRLVASRFDKRFEKASGWDGKVTPFVQRKLKVIESESRNCTSIVPVGRGEFDVVEGSTHFTVRLNDHFCDCQKWKISSLPCKHASRCILRMNYSLEDYCSQWFSVDMYKKLYDNIIHPISDCCMWGSSDLPQLDPPFEFKKKGRPPKHKRRESVFRPDQPSKQSTRLSGTKRCTKCNKLGHNSRTCGCPRDENGYLVNKYKRKKKDSSDNSVGRPRKNSAAHSSQVGAA